jgi:hypothetical protein
MEPTKQSAECCAEIVRPWLPEGRVALPLDGSVYWGPSTWTGALVQGADGQQQLLTGAAAVASFLHSGRVTELATLLFLIHCALSVAIVWLYRVRGFPPWLAAGELRIVRLHRILPVVIGLGALFSIPWPAAARILHLFWWSMMYTPLEEGRAPGEFAVGAAGISAVRMGFGLVYLSVIAWIVRMAVRREVRRSNRFVPHCPTCAYPRVSTPSERCPECGDQSEPTKSASFHLRLPGHTFVWPCLTVAIVLFLVAAPWMLALLGRLMPEAVREGIGRAWYALW